MDQQQSEKDIYASGELVIPEFNDNMTEKQNNEALVVITRTYLNSCLGMEFLVRNDYWNPLAQTFLVQGRLLRTKRSLYTELAYRLRQMQVATQYKDMLGLDFPDCHEFDIESTSKDMQELFPPYAKAEHKAKRRAILEHQRRT